jgi:hypothetical protein
MENDDSKSWAHITRFIVKHESVPLVNMFHATRVQFNTAISVVLNVRQTFPAKRVKSATY